MRCWTADIIQYLYAFIITHTQHLIFGRFRFLTSPAALPEAANTFALTPGPDIKSADLTVLIDSIQAFSVEPAGKVLKDDRIVHEDLFMPCRIPCVVSFAVRCIIRLS